MKFNLKVIVGFFIVFYMIIVALFYNFYKDLVIQDAKREVTSILNTTNALRHYIENTQKPVIYKLQQEGKLYQEFFDPKVLSASYIARHIHERYVTEQRIKHKTPYKYKLATNNPRNPKNMADAFESEILQKFQKGEIREFSTILKEDDQDYFFTAIPIDRNKRSCMRCHGTPDNAPKEMLDIYGTKAGFYEQIGDIRAIISLKVPVSHIITAHIKDFYLSAFIALIIFVIFYIFIYIIYKKDLKLQNEREELLIQQNKLASMGEMIGNIAHQWRQPLTQLSSILINLELHADRDRLTKEKLAGKVKEANEQIAFMSNTIDDFRNFFASGKTKKEYHIKEIIDLSSHLMSAALDRHHIALQIDIKENFTLEGYPSEVTQALVNIIKNAKEVFTERETQNPKIAIQTHQETDKKLITIEDNAGGITIQPIEKIFEPYFTSKHASVGTGIGLYMSKMIIEKNNHGTLTVENSEQGAKFTIAFL